MIPTELIERALALTCKPRTYCHVIDTSITKNEDYNPSDFNDIWDYPTTFSMEKFCYYLMSPEFVEKFHEIGKLKGIFGKLKFNVFGQIGEAIHEYQQGNEQPLISLLEKIPN